MIALDVLKSAVSGEAFSLVKDVVGKFIGDPDQRHKAEMEVQALAAQREAQLEETLRSRMAMTSDIIKSEMSQGDTFTKRARPMLVYWGMVLVTVDHLASLFIERQLPDLPEQFWLAWGGVVSIWIVGRSAEKFKGGKTTKEGNPVLSKIMG
tara:strand:+ start:368 stop:823 length:456 start_codon:yes stop_codon:yes gene_type:complete